MAKRQPKPNEPVVDDYVRLRGRDAEGHLYQINTNGWCLVNWSPPRSGPKIVHLRELEKYTPPGA